MVSDLVDMKKEIIHSVGPVCDCVKTAFLGGHVDMIFAGCIRESRYSAVLLNELSSTEVMRRKTRKLDREEFVESEVRWMKVF